VTPARWIAVAVLVLAAVFAWTGGTFSERNYLRLQRSEVAARQRLATLKREVDSLRAFRDSLENSPVVQERVARERFGMVRPGELVFTIVPDSSAAAVVPAGKKP
jgi:cell division protein FtsB